MVTERRGISVNLGLPRSAHCRASQGWSFAQFSGDKLRTTETQAGGAPKADDDTQPPSAEIDSGLANQQRQPTNVNVTTRQDSCSTFQLARPRSYAANQGMLPTFPRPCPKPDWFARLRISFCPRLLLLCQLASRRHTCPCCPTNLTKPWHCLGRLDSPELFTRPGPLSRFLD